MNAVPRSAASMWRAGVTQKVSIEKFGRWSDKRRISVIIKRPAVRAIILSPEDELLLLRIRSPEGGDWFWITPGGGLEPGETNESALRRELKEEVGLEYFLMGPLVWRRQHTFDWAGKRLCQYEEFHVVHVPRFEPHMSDAHEMHVLDRFRWWAVAELALARERLTPLSLAEIVERYLAHGPPRELPKTEILID